MNKTEIKIKLCHEVTQENVKESIEKLYGIIDEYKLTFGDLESYLHYGFIPSYVVTTCDDFCCGLNEWETEIEYMVIDFGTYGMYLDLVISPVLYKLYCDLVE